MPGKYQLKVGQKWRRSENRSMAKHSSIDDSFLTNMNTESNRERTKHPGANNYGHHNLNFVSIGELEGAIS